MSSPVTRIYCHEHALDEEDVETTGVAFTTRNRARSARVHELLLAQLELDHTEAHTKRRVAGLVDAITGEIPWSALVETGDYSPRALTAIKDHIVESEWTPFDGKWTGEAATITMYSETL